MKLELKHLAGYFPYGLNIKYRYEQQVSREEWKKFERDIVLNGSYLTGNLDNITPILRPLSDLTKEIEVNGEKFTPMNILFYCDEFDGILGHSSIEYANDFINSNDRLSLCYDFYFWQKLLEWHFDIYGLIEKGLGIHINTLK